MKKLFSIAFLQSIIVLGLYAQQNNVFFTSSPCISPDGKHIVFTYESDLWRVDTDGGLATRLTGMQGEESRARYSPDGKWITFTGSQYGSQDIYLMPAEGGDVKQLTFHEAFDHVENWSWDSKLIYFSSSRENRVSAYSIDIDGSTPKRLYHDYFHTVHNIAPHPNGEIFFSETSESKSQAYRKGYKGSYNPQIQSYNAKSGAFQIYTQHIGKDMWPTIDREGNVYFVSDEKNGQYNLAILNGKKTKTLTNFENSIKQPIVSANGDYVVFEKDFQIYKYNTKTAKAEKVNIKLFNNVTSQKEKEFSVASNISYFDVSPDGKKLVFISRGELFVSDIKGKFIQKINTHFNGRSTEVKWHADNRNIIYTQTNKTGFTNLYKVRVDTINKPKQLTNESENNRELATNKDRSKIVFLSGRNNVKMLYLNNDSVTTIVTEELWGFQNSTPSISPNDEYVLFTAKKNFEEDIFIYHLENKKLTNITKTGITESSPVWSPDGKYIYFTSNRTRASYPWGLNDARIYRLPLQKFGKEFKALKYDSLFIDKSKLPKPKIDSLAPKPKYEAYTIDFNNMLSRMELVSPNIGNQSDAFITNKDEKSLVIYASNHLDNEYNLYITTYEPFERTKTDKIEGAKTFGTYIVQVSDKLYTLLNGNIHSLNLEGKKVEKINIEYDFHKNLKSEFDQMFEEVWANVNENFYNETFHGLNWNNVGNRYRKFLPYVSSRTDLRTLITEMLGDLNSSHTGFSSFGDEEKTYYSTITLADGIIYDEDNPYQVKRIVDYSPADNKNIDLKPGDKLVAVNGNAIEESKNRNAYFAKADPQQEMELTFKRKDSTFTVYINPVNFSTINSLRYDEWIAKNQSIVDQKSNKKIAYAYMKDMGTSELNKFLIDMASESHDRDALILDIRYNNGGNVHDNVLQFLSQKPYLKWKYREGAPTVQPNFTPAGKPIILLTNEQSLSDAEMTTEGFKRLGLGKVVGTETYRWIIFTSGKGLVDGSFYRLPSWGCYTMDGKNIEQVGVAPDIFVGMDFKDRLNGTDPQLDRAISEILSALK
jgi:tricorn protease